MSQARTNARRRKQMANNYTHLAPGKRPRYKRKLLMNVGEAIQQEKRRAAAEARRSSGKKK